MNEDEQMGDINPTTPRGVLRGVSKVVEDSRRPPALQAATPKMAVRPV
jgi:hypothetical protein